MTENLNTGISTLYKILDENVGGEIHPPQLILISASTGGGKTTILMNLALNISEQNIPVFHITLETTADNILTRYRRMMGEIMDENIDFMSNSIHDFNNIHIVKMNAGSTVNEIDQQIELYSTPPPALSVLIIDYIDLINNTAVENNYYKILEQVIIDIKALLVKRNIICITACQQSRSEAHHTDPYNFKYSSQREMLGVLPDISIAANYNIQTHDVILHILKNTQGVSGNTVYLEIDPKTTRILDSIRRYEPNK